MRRTFRFRKIRTLLLTKLTPPCFIQACKGQAISYHKHNIKIFYACLCHVLGADDHGTNWKLLNDRVLHSQAQNNLMRCMLCIIISDYTTKDLLETVKEANEKLEPSRNTYHWKTMVGWLHNQTRIRLVLRDIYTRWLESRRSKLLIYHRSLCKIGWKPQTAHHHDE